MVAEPRLINVLYIPGGSRISCAGGIFIFYFQMSLIKCILNDFV